VWILVKQKEIIHSLIPLGFYRWRLISSTFREGERMARGDNMKSDSGDSDIIVKAICNHITGPSRNGGRREQLREMWCCNFQKCGVVSYNPPEYSMSQRSHKGPNWPTRDEEFFTRRDLNKAA
jgi:hypothetical protein